MTDIVERLRKGVEPRHDVSVLTIEAQMREAADEIEQLRTTLQTLLECSGHLSVFGGDPSVKAVRQAGKYIKAVELARRALEPKS